MIFAYKPKNQKGPAKEYQTFIVSYVYNYDEWIGNKEIEFIEDLKKIGLRFYKETCIFRTKKAYRILIMDKDVVLNNILKYVSKFSQSVYEDTRLKGR